MSYEQKYIQNHRYEMIQYLAVLTLLFVASLFRNQLI